jgi:endo-alpha-1,4-polygalactosaminidase (GH114 family)
VTARRPLYLTVLAIVPLAVACGGGPTLDGALETAAGGGSGGAGGSAGASGGQFRGDSSAMPSFGGWAWGSVPADAVARAGFEWFETGYPGDTATNDTLRAAGIRPFAYINLGELHDDLKADARYTGPILRTNGDWGTYLVDVTDPSWKDWLVRRADYAYQTGSRGVKWDVATPDQAPGKSRDDVNRAMAEVMQRILDMHPDMKFIVNQGFLFALAYPQYVHGVETEGLFSASSYQAAWLQPWKDPYYWGPQYDEAKRVRALGIPVFIAEYADPSSGQARELYDAITAQGMVPYITSDHWNIRGWGYNVAPGW